MPKKEEEQNNWDPKVEHIRDEPRPSNLASPLPRKKLPKELQDVLNDDEKLWDIVYEGKAPESTDSSVRYAGYAARLRTIMLAAHRYVAYTSDIGESFRPIAHPNMVRAAYGISWAYIGGDVIHEGYKAFIRQKKILRPEERSKIDDYQLSLEGRIPAVGEVGKVAAIDDYRAVMAQRAVFQSVASMGLPAFTIHSVVRYSGRAMKNVKNVTIRTWGPIGLGLAAVPALPYLFDKPVEQATEWIFHKVFETVGGPDAVGHKAGAHKVAAVKEKEL